MTEVAEIFDAHFHVIDPRFPLVPNRGYAPPPFTVGDYRRCTAGLGVLGGAVVSGSFQGADRAYLEAALGELGPGFVGTVQLGPEATNAELDRLDALGVRAVRFNLRRGGPAGVADLVPLARRVHERAGWHAEVYVDGTEVDDALFRVLTSLPAVSIDHLGLSEAGLPAVLRLVERGVKVKATGFGRVDLDVPRAIARIAAVDPSALLFGTDLPSTRARRPFDPRDVDTVREALTSEQARRALRDNALAFYRPPLVL